MTENKNSQRRVKARVSADNRGQQAGPDNLFLLSPTGEPTYLTVLLMKKVEESLRAKGLKLT